MFLSCTVLVSAVVVCLSISARPTVRLSLAGTVTKTAKSRITQTAPYANGVTPYGDAKWRWGTGVGTNWRFRPTSRDISERVQDRDSYYGILVNMVNSSAYSTKIVSVAP